MGSSRKIPNMGSVKGAGQTTTGTGPGPAAMRVRGNAAEPNNNYKTPSGKPPKGMSIEREGE